MGGVIFVALGGALGALGRYYVSMLLASKLGSDFPYGTLAVNALGGFFILFFITLFIDRLSIDPMWKLFVVTGMLGGFTTFSSFTFETISLFMDREYAKAFINLFSNNILAFGFGFLGYISAKSI